MKVKHREDNEFDMQLKPPMYLGSGKLEESARSGQAISDYQSGRTKRSNSS